VGPLVVDIREAARLLSVSERSIRRWIQSGQLHAVRLSRRVLLPLSECERLAREGTDRRNGAGRDLKNK